MYAVDVLQEKPPELDVATVRSIRTFFLLCDKNNSGAIEFEVSSLSLSCFLRLLFFISLHSNGFDRVCVSHSCRTNNRPQELNDVARELGMDNLGKEELQILMTLLDQDRDGKIGMHNLW